MAQTPFETLHTPQVDRGEPGSTLSSSQLVEALSNPADLDEVVREFDAGNTVFGDVSGLTVNERQIVLDIAARGKQDLTSEEFALHQKAADNLRAHMFEGEHLPGWTFLSEAQAFINQSYPWADQLGTSFAQSIGISVGRLVEGLNEHRYLQKEAHGAVLNFAEMPENFRAVAYYLASRSLFLEAEQRRLYAEHLIAAKATAIDQLVRLGPQMGLAPAYQRRAMAQIERVEFGCPDELEPPQLDGRKYKGANQIGALRVMFTPPESVSLLELAGIVRHEVNHAGSAQAGTKRAGLRVDKNKGDDENEGVTEFLVQEAVNFPTVIPRPDNWFAVDRMDYQGQFNATYGLQLKRPELFAALYRAYYGQIDDPGILQESFDMFRRAFSAVTYTSAEQ